MTELIISYVVCIFIFYGYVSGPSEMPQGERRGYFICSCFWPIILLIAIGIKLANIHTKKNAPKNPGGE